MKNTNLILGKVGIGKTTGYMFEKVNEIIEKEENLLIVDSKEEYYKTYAETLNKKGYNTYIINFKEPLKSNGFNPLLMPYKYYKSANKDKAIKIISNFSKSLMYDSNAMDPFWNNSAASYLTGIILLLFNEAKEEEISLASVHVMITQIENNIEKFREYLKKVDVASSEYTFLSSTVFAPNETRGGIISVLKMNLTKYLSLEYLLNLLCSNEIDLSNIKNKTALFIINNNYCSKLTNAIISEVINTKEKFNYIFDNFDSISRINEFEDLLDNAIVDGNTIYVVSRNIEYLNQTYGNLIVDKFENIEYVQDGLSLTDIGNYNEYPDTKQIDKKFFDIMSIL